MNLKILSCNIRVDVPADSDTGNGWDSRKGLCIEVMRAQSADIICVQECRKVHYADLTQGLPQLFTADCNTDASNPAIAVMKAGGWQDTYTAIHGPADPGFTYHGFIGPAYADGKDKERMTGKIDFIFTRGSVKVQELLAKARETVFP